nr:unnamed protein product [Spirometra erinaceieuropaei]
MAAKSAMSMLYLVKRAFSYFDEDCFAEVFQTFVLPHLEFAIQSRRPWTAKDLGILENVQRRATKLVSGQLSLPYETRLANIDLFPLSYRQLRGDLIQAFRIVRNQGCCLAFGDFFELATTTNLRGHPLKLRVAGARVDIRKFFFSNRVVAALNALPEDVVNLASRPGVLHLAQPAVTEVGNSFVVVGGAADVGFVRAVLLGEYVADDGVLFITPVLVLAERATENGQRRRLDCFPHSTPLVIHGSVVANGGGGGVINWKAASY